MEPGRRYRANHNRSYHRCAGVCGGPPVGRVVSLGGDRVFGVNVKRKRRKINGSEILGRKRLSVKDADLALN